ncbi:MAG: hypothetical protein J5902_07155 [Paludibacteraceae bacterium]|jgi:large-conductance mechanosensitive channel|nr:hypothetical protein [Paludibacteraceae bacterium]MBQ9296186.1 hypothetical protein [Paludibacteraceae bacterium]
MKALIAFAIMAVVVLTLIEVNERMKAGKQKNQPSKTPQDDSCIETCAECGLLSVCDKEAKNSKKTSVK